MNSLLVTNSATVPCGSKKTAPLCVIAYLAVCCYDDVMMTSFCCLRFVWYWWYHKI